MKFLSICACALATILSAKTASAQAGFYALFTGANLDNTQTSQPNVSLPSTSITTTTQLFGPTLGIYGDIPTPVVKIGCDFRGELLNGDGKQHYNGVIGPRVSVALPAVKLKLYGEFLYGFGSYKTTTPPPSTPTMSTSPESTESSTRCSTGGYWSSATAITSTDPSPPRDLAPAWSCAFPDHALTGSRHSAETRRRSFCQGVPASETNVWM